MDYKKVLSQWDKSLEYFGRAKWLPLKERKVRLFDHDIIEMGKIVKLKWKRIAIGKKKDFGRIDCAYCLKYHNFFNLKGRCLGCPIEHLTGVIECRETPYYNFRKAGLEKREAERMKIFVDKIFIKSLLLIDWRKYYEMPSM